MGLSFACLCPAFSDTNMFNDAINSADPPLVFWDDSKDTIMKLINRMGINR